MFVVQLQLLCSPSLCLFSLVPLFVLEMERAATPVMITMHNGYVDMYDPKYVIPIGMRILYCPERFSADYTFSHRNTVVIRAMTTMLWEHLLEKVGNPCDRPKLLLCVPELRQSENNA